MFSYVVTSQKSTAVQNSVICNFTGPNDRNLIIGRGNHLEVHTLRDNGLCAEQDLYLFGKISALEFYRPSSMNQDVLFVLTERKYFCILGYDEVSRKVVSRATGNIKDRVGRELESGIKAIVDPEYRVIGAVLYEGLLKIIPIEGSSFKEAFNVRLDIVKFLDLKFIYGCSRPTICILHEEHRKGRHITTFTLDLRDRELIQGPWSQKYVDQTAKFLIPVPSPTNGVIVVGENLISYVSGSGSGDVQSAVMGNTEICSYGRIDKDGSRYLLGDHKGNLYVVVLLKGSGGLAVTNVMIDLIGITSIAETLCYLDNGIVFVGSVFGDSQLLRLSSTSDQNGSYITILETYVNIGPIVDMVVVDTERQGQSVVTCSGAYKDGSLRVVRSGIGVHEQASIEVAGIKGTWALRDRGSTDGYDKYLVQSFIGQTRVLSIDQEEMSEATIPGLLEEEQTLLCCDVASLLLQVTPRVVRLISLSSMEAEPLLAEEVMDSAVTLAAAGGAHLLLCQSGGTVRCLQLTGPKPLETLGSVCLDADVACVSVFSYTCPQTGVTSEVAALGMWTDQTVRLLLLPRLEEVHRVLLSDVNGALQYSTQASGAQARDVMVATLDDGVTYLFVGLGDGTLLHFVVTPATVTAAGGSEYGPTLTSRKKVVLGTSPIALSRFVSSETGAVCVFVSCDRPTIIHTHNNKLSYTAANVTSSILSPSTHSGHSVTGMVPFNCALFPGCLALSAESGLLLTTMDPLQKLHIRSLALGETPRRIAFHKQREVFAVCTEKTTWSEGGGESSNRVLFLEEGTMSLIYTYELDSLEQALSVHSCELLSSDPSAPQEEYVVVGTGYVVPQEAEPSRGRLLLFAVREGRVVGLLAQRDTKAAVFSIAGIAGRLVIGVGSKVQVFRLSFPATESSTLLSASSMYGPELQLECGHHGHILALYLKAKGDCVLVGDLLRSVSLLQFRPAADGVASSLQELCRDPSANSMRAVEILDGADTDSSGDAYLGADDCGNLFTVCRHNDAATEEERGKLLLHGEYHLGDYVNAIRHGSLKSHPMPNERTAGNAATRAAPSVLFGTISGAIGTILTIDREKYSQFCSVQKAMASVLPGVGGLSHEGFRTFFNDRRTAGQNNMVDGDLVERLLDLEPAMQEQVVRQINQDRGEPLVGGTSVEEWLRRVEEMTLLH